MQGQSSLAETLGVTQNEPDDVGMMVPNDGSLVALRATPGNVGTGLTSCRQEFQPVQVGVDQRLVVT